jgi:dipeptidyl aminopeptidase/acylaminoacyl peptidase
LIEARQRFTTRLQRQEKINEPVPVPPPNLFRSVSYSSPAGELAAYVGVSPGKERKHPAIIWIVGGFANSISEIAWTPGPPENDQSATTFREAGIVMMYPSLRGGNRNPGYLEGFYGEVDDVLAAAEFLAKLDYVNPERIYLGGHSTGGTLALLAAECSDRFRAVFAFGPVSNVAGYGQDVLPFSVLDRDEVNLRSPGKWLANIRTPTFVFEGTRRSNIGELRLMSRTARNPQIHFHPLQGADHFSGLGPVSRLIARKILADEGPSCGIAFTPEELAQALRP